MRLRYLMLAVLIFAGGAAAVLWSSRPAKEVPLPSPNGRDYYLSAVKSLDARVSNGGLTNAEALKRDNAVNQEALRQLRLGLGFRCVFPPEPFVNGLPTELASFKHLSILLLSEGGLALSKGRTHDAAQAYLDGIRFGQEISRGVLIYDMLGISFEYNACTALERCKDKLSHADRQYVIDQLSILRTNREPFSNVFEREKMFMHLSHKSLMQSIMWPILWYKLRPALQKSETKGLQNTARIELLRADFALENFNDTNHRWPASLSELKLNPTPADPFSPENSSLPYSPHGAGFSLYSVGPDRKDDHGNPSRDITLDSKFLDRPN